MHRQEWEIITRVFGFTSVTLGVIAALVLTAITR